MGSAGRFGSHFRTGTVILGGAVGEARRRTAAGVPVLVIVFLLTVLSSSSVEFFAPYSVTLRVLAIALLWWPFDPRLLPPANRQRPAMSAMFSIAIGSFLFWLLDLLAHGATYAGGGLVGTAGYLLICLGLVRWSSRDVRGSLSIALMIVVALSLVAAGVAPDVAFQNARLRGIAENANTLGLYAALLVVLSSTSQFRRVWWALSIAASIATLAMTGSRAALLLSAIVLAFRLVRARPQLRVPLVVFGLLSVCTAGVGWGHQIASLTIFRTNDSRSHGIDLAVEALNEHWWFGVGMARMTDAAVAGTWYATLIIGGMAGTVAMVIGCVLFLQRASKTTQQALVMAFAMLVYSAFESWLIGLMGPVAITLVAAFFSFAGEAGVAGRSSPASRSGRTFGNVTVLKSGAE